MRHAANIATSERLKRVLDALVDGGWHSSWSLMQATGLVAVGSAVSELRANGCEVETRRVGQGKYEYRLASGPAPAGDPITHHPSRITESIRQPEQEGLF